MKTFYIGVDPGASGGLACYKGTKARAIGMPDTERDIWDWFNSIALYRQRVIAVIEKVGGFIGKKQPGSAMFKFGQSYGTLRMALIASGAIFEEITPQKWQKRLGITPRGKSESPSKWKGRLKAKAQQLFPDLKVTLKTADALLILEYCRRRHQGKL